MFLFLAQRGRWAATLLAALTALSGLALPHGGADAAIPALAGPSAAAQTPSGTGFTAIAAGAAHSLALTGDGRVFAWGDNFLGELGNDGGSDGTCSDVACEGAPVPAQTPAGVQFTAIAAGYSHSLALTRDGQIYAWGDNTDGQLGNNSTAYSPVPVQVQTPAGVQFTAIAAGWEDSLALASDGTIYAWGFNGSGQVGNGGAGNPMCFGGPCETVPVPVQAPPGVRFTAIAAADIGAAEYNLALASDGSIYAWGVSHFRAFGDASTTSSSVPVQVQTPAGVQFTAIAAGYSHILALASDGTIYAWGDNQHGQLGSGAASNAVCSEAPCGTGPVQVQAPAGVTFTAIAAGFDYSLALAGDGTVYAWGDNSDGELGNNATTDSPLPVQVQVPAGVQVMAIAASWRHSLALTGDGSVYAWGRNNDSQLGNGSTTNSPVPVQVQPPL